MIFRYRLAEKILRASLPLFTTGFVKMLVQVRVTTNAKTPSVRETGENALEVRVDAKAVDGRANKRLLNILSEHYKVPRSSLTILRGARSRDKIVEIHEDSPKPSS